MRLGQGMMASQPPETPAWDAWLWHLERLRPEILRDPVASAMVKMAGHVFTELRTSSNRQAGELQAEIRRLTAELDSVQRRKVLLCMARIADEAMEISRDEEPGTILRTTDTMEAWELGTDRIWKPRD